MHSLSLWFCFCYAFPLQQKELGRKIISRYDRILFFNFWLCISWKLAYYCQVLFNCFYWCWWVWGLGLLLPTLNMTMNLEWHYAVLVSHFQVLFNCIGLSWFCRFLLSWRTELDWKPVNAYIRWITGG